MEHFEQVTGNKLLLERDASPDDLKKRIESRADEKDTADKSTMGKAKAAGLITLSCIRVLGGVAANVASNVSLSFAACMSIGAL